MKRRLVIAISIIFLLSIIPVSTSAAENPTKTTVTATKLNVREYASPKARVIGSYKQSAVVYIHDYKAGGWAEIRYNGKPAFVAYAYLQEVDDYTWTTVSTVNATSLNVRQYPSPKAKVIGSLKKGSVVYIHDFLPGGWVEIRHNGKVAYVAEAYLNIDYDEFHACAI